MSKVPQGQKKHVLKQVASEAGKACTQAGCLKGRESVHTGRGCLKGRKSMYTGRVPQGEGKRAHRQRLPQGQEKHVNGQGASRGGCACQGWHPTQPGFIAMMSTGPHSLRYAAVSSFKTRSFWWAAHHPHLTLYVIREFATILDNTMKVKEHSMAP
eukprot:1159765-Pelagomonas_calceolata.AAC.27